jgi:hypothetical protein
MHMGGALRVGGASEISAKFISTIAPTPSQYKFKAQEKPLVPNSKSWWELRSRTKSNWNAPYWLLAISGAQISSSLPSLYLQPKPTLYIEK